MSFDLKKCTDCKKEFQSERFLEPEKCPCCGSENTGWSKHLGVKMVRDGEDLFIQNGQFWNIPPYTQVQVLYLNKNQYMLLHCPGWSLSRGWTPVQSLHWGEDKNGKPNGRFIYDEKELCRILKDASLIDVHLETVPNDESTPPKLCRQIFGKIALEEGHSGAKGGVERLPDSWKETECWEKTVPTPDYGPVYKHKV